MRKSLPIRGFTLIELMVVISVIAILSTIALFGLSKAQASARDVSRQQMMKGVQNGNDVACGSGGSGVCGSITCYGWNGPSKGDTGWCGGDGTGAWKAGYTMTVGGSSYSLTLTKESGGTSTFTSPR